MGAAELWAATQASYSDAELLALTSRYARENSTTVDAVGEAAAAEVIALWPLYAQTDYDDDNAQHVAVGKMGVIAILKRQSGASADAADAAFDAVFGADGIVGRIKNTGARARVMPAAASGEPGESSTQRRWGDAANLPPGLMPDRTSINDT